jgi:hypothetical protein
VRDESRIDEHVPPDSEGWSVVVSHAMGQSRIVIECKKKIMVMMMMMTLMRRRETRLVK